MNTLYYTQEALAHIPAQELQNRQAACRKFLAQQQPEASGLLVFSRLNIYYLTGTLASGLLWLPANAAQSPVLLVRKALERAQLESPLLQIHAFRSFSEIADLCQQSGSPCQGTVAAEMSNITWAMGQMLQKRLPLNFVPGDAVLQQARMRKSPWEVDKMRQAGKLHEVALTALAGRIAPGMTENQIARLCIDVFLEYGHGGITRMSGLGEESLFGHVAVGDTGNYPHYYNGPMGFRGIHPALPCLGSDKVWEKNMPLLVDYGFTLEGYVTDKTQMFWSGAESSFPGIARQAYNVCVEIHNEGAALLRPGTSPAHIWQHCLEIVKDTPFASGYMGLERLPFLGHGIGLVVDELPVVAKGFNEPLEEGMTLALEPKISLPGFGMVGIENTFAVTAHGGENLSGSHCNILWLE